MKGIVFSTEALLSLLALVGFAVLLLPGPGVSFSEVYLYQLAQDVLEVSVKSEENRGDFIEFAAGGASAGERITEKYSRVINALGDYCLVLEINHKTLNANCRGLPVGRKTTAAAERILFDGERFLILRARISMN